MANSIQTPMHLHTQTRFVFRCYSYNNGNINIDASSVSQSAPPRAPQRTCARSMVNPRSNIWKFNMASVQPGTSTNELEFVQCCDVFGCLVNSKFNPQASFFTVTKDARSVATVYEIAVSIVFEWKIFWIVTFSYLM